MTMIDTPIHYGREQYKKRMTETMDFILMDAIGKGDYDSFEEYQKDMEKLTSKSFFRR